VKFALSHPFAAAADKKGGTRKVSPQAIKDPGTGS